MRPPARAVRRQHGFEVQGHTTKRHINTVLYKRRNEIQTWKNLRISVLVLLFGCVLLGFSMPPLLGLGNGQWGSFTYTPALWGGLYASRVSAQAEYESVSLVEFSEQGLALVGTWGVRNRTSRFRKNAWRELYAPPETKRLPNCVSALLSRRWRGAFWFRV